MNTLSDRICCHDFLKERNSLTMMVGMVDHSGGVENEEGLDIEELYGLFKAGLASIVLIKLCL